MTEAKKDKTHYDEKLHRIMQAAREEVIRQKEQAGRKDDSGKPRLDLLPWAALDAVGYVLGYGARKYDADNWRLVPDAERRYIAAALRHISAHQQGEAVDPESGLRHLAHAACSLLFVLDLASSGASDDTFQRISKIVAFLSANGGEASRTEIIKHCFNGHIKAGELDAALDIARREVPPRIRTKIVVTEGNNSREYTTTAICLAGASSWGREQ